VRAPAGGPDAKVVSVELASTTLPPGLNAYLVDEQGRATDLSETPRRDLVIEPGGDRRLEVVVGDRRWSGDLLSGGRTRILSLYPVPARDRVQLFFRIGTAGKVDVSVYDVRGRMVDRLFGRMTEPGEYGVEWRPRKRDAASGVYFVRLQTPAGSESRKIVLVR
jgi:hypothetical protein